MQYYISPFPRNVILHATGDHLQIIPIRHRLRLTIFYSQGRQTKVSIPFRHPPHAHAIDNLFANMQLCRRTQRPEANLTILLMRTVTSTTEPTQSRPAPPQTF